VKVFRLSVCRKVGEWRAIVHQLGYPHDVTTFLSNQAYVATMLPGAGSHLPSLIPLQYQSDPLFIDDQTLHDRSPVGLGLERAGSQVQRLLEGL
jgi:hypothetical protein